MPPFDAAALFALLGTLLYSLMIIATRRLGGIDSTTCTMAWSTGFFIVGCGLVLPSVWVTPTAFDWVLFGALGIISGAGMFFFVRAYYHGRAATIAPFDYTAMLRAIVLGMALWGDVPGWLPLTGMLVIVISGLYIMHRESRPARAPVQP